MPNKKPTQQPPQSAWQRLNVAPSRSVDTGHQTRLNALIDGVVAEIRTKKGLSRVKKSYRTVKAGARALKNNTRLTATDAGFYFFQSATVVGLTILALPATPVLGAAVGSVGILGVTAAKKAVESVFDNLIRKTVGKVTISITHKWAVEEVLKALRKFEADPLTGGPDMRADKRKATRSLALQMIEKLISDIDKLAEEIKKTLKTEPGPGAQTTDREMIRLVLEEGKKAAGSGGFTERLQILPIDTKSKVAEKYGGWSLLHLRLQRIRSYIAWLHKLVENLQNESRSVLIDVQLLEPELLGWISDQVHAVGNHSTCEAQLCFGPDPAEIQVVEIQKNDLQFNAANEIIETNAKTMGTLLGFNSAYRSMSIAHEKSYVEDDAIDAAIEEQTEGTIEEIGEQVADKVGSEAAGKMGSEFVGDALGAAVKALREHFRVKRPLMSRVKALQAAMHKGGVLLDREIIRMAEKNDLNAIKHCLNKAIVHYPDRIYQRSKKLHELHSKLKKRDLSLKSKNHSIFKNCTSAATAVRYLYKVYHNIEKEEIHLHFVSLGLEALSQQVFGVPASRAMAEKPPVAPGMLAAAIAGLKETNPSARPDPNAFVKALQQQKVRLKKATPNERPDPNAFVKALKQQKERLKATTTQVADPIAQMRAAWAPLGQIDLSVAGKTYIKKVQPPNDQPVDNMLTDEEWKSMSWIFGARSNLTAGLDEALQAYRESYLRNRWPQATQRPVRQAELQSLLVYLNCRRPILLKLEAAITSWLDKKSASPNSARRPSVLQLKAMVDREASALDDAIHTLSSVSSQATELGMGVLPVDALNVPIIVDYGKIEQKGA